MDDVQSRSSNSMPQAAILVLGSENSDILNIFCLIFIKVYILRKGDNDSGKTTLVARLQRVEDPKKGSGLEYHYLEVNPDFRDGNSKKKNEFLRDYSKTLSNLRLSVI